MTDGTAIMNKQMTSDFDGLTTGTCCAACGPICIISGDICIHPHKAGMQAAHLMKPDVMDRYAAARRFLEVQTLSAKHAQEQKHGTE